MTHDSTLKPKQKNDAEPRKDYGWKEFFKLLLIFGVIVACGATLFLLITISFPALSPQEVTIACDSLDLPADSSFCQDTANQRLNHLIATFTDTYPPSETSLTALTDHFGATMVRGRAGEYLISVPKTLIRFSVLYEGDRVIEYKPQQNIPGD